MKTTDTDLALIAILIRIVQDISNRTNVLTVNCLYKPAPLDNFISNGVNAPRKRRASSATPKSANKWVGGEVITKTLFFFVSFVSLW